MVRRGDNRHRWTMTSAGSSRNRGTPSRSALRATTWRSSLEVAQWSAASLVARDRETESTSRRSRSRPTTRNPRPGRVRGGIIVTMLLGMAGSVVAGFLGDALGCYRAPAEGPGILASILGAMLLLFVYRLAIGRRTRLI